MKKILPVFVLISIIGVAAAGYFYYQYQQAKKEIQTIKTDPSTAQKAAQAEVKSLVAEVGKLVDLPTGEEPTVATVTDVDKLKDQDFFKKAKNGDKVIIYTNAKKALLYDPIAHKVLDFAPVNIGTSSAQQSQQARIALRNGTTTAGLSAKVESDLKKAFPQATITLKDNATKTDYDKSLVVILNDSAKDAAANLAKTLNMTVGDLPTGESKPKDIDILILLGKDHSS